MKRQWMLCISCFFAVCVVSTSGWAEQTDSTVPSHTAKSKKRKKVETTADKPVESFEAQATTMQSPRLPAGERQQRVLSVDSETDVSATLKTTAEKDLLQQTVLAKKSAEFVEIEGTGKQKKHIPLQLNLGAFRNQELTEGYVPPPSVTDFAVYFRATSAAMKAQTPEGAKAAPVLVSRPGEMTTDEFKKQSDAEALRVQTIESIKQILATKPSTDQKVEMLMRMAEIQVERHAYALELEIRDFNDAHEKWVATQKGTQPEFKANKSNTMLLLAIDSIRTVVNEFPSHARNPEALFNLGFLLTQIGSDSATLYFDKLVQKYPKSDLVPDAYLALGEYYFSKQKFDKAMATYQKILDFKGTRSYNYAVYKIGWTWFNIRSEKEAETKKNLGKSLAAFKLVVKLAESVPNDKSLKDLKRDALRDMVLVFVDLSDVKGAQSYFESLQEPELYISMLERLAWQYADNGEYQAAIEIYNKLVSEGSGHEKLPQFYAKLPELYSKTGQYPELLKHLQAMSAAFAPDGLWMTKYASNKDLLESRNRVLSYELRTWSQRLHAEAQKKKNEQRYLQALAAYSLYLDNFGETAESYTAHFYKAEILVYQQRYLEASDEYMKSAALDEKFGLRAKHTNVAIQNSIICLDKMLDKTPALDLPQPGKATSKIPLTNFNERIVRSIDTFVRLFPQDALVLPLAHRAARIHYAFGDYASARERWIALSRNFSQSKEIYDGLRLVLKVYVERKDWDTAIVDSRSFLAIPGVRENELGKDVVAVLKVATFAKAMALDAEGKKNEAADLFLAYHKEFQDDPDAPKALFNAANNRFKAAKVDEAITVLKIILAQYPKSNLVQNAHYMIASAYDSLGRFSDAANSYEQLAHDNPRNPVAPDSLMRAAEQRYATGELEVAAKDAQDLIRIYPTHAHVSSAWLLLGKVQIKRNSVAEAAAVFVKGAEHVLPTHPSQSMLMFGLAADNYWRAGDRLRAAQSSTQGKALWTKLSEKERNGPAWEGVRLIAGMELEFVDEKLPHLLSKAITDGMKVVEQFQKIREEANGLSTRYAAVVKLGNAEAGVAALARVAEIHEYLAQVLIKTPIPAGASPEEREQFKGQIDKVSIPLQEEAQRLYYTAWQKGIETEAMTPVMKKLHEKLAAMRPAEFRSVVQELPAPTYFSSDVYLTKETSQILK